MSIDETILPQVVLDSTITALPVESRVSDANGPVNYGGPLDWHEP